MLRTRFSSVNESPGRDVRWSSRTLGLSAAIGLLCACGGSASNAPGATDSGRATSADVRADAQPAKAAVSAQPPAGRGAAVSVVGGFEPVSLVPADTVAVVRIESMTALQDAILKIGAIAERTGSPIPLRESLMLACAQAGVEWGKIRTKEPIVVAVRLPDGGMEPDFIVYAPVSQAAAATQGLARQTEVDGDYIAITQPGVTAPPAAPPEWCQGMQGGLVQARIDARAVLRRLGPMAGMALASAFPSQGLTPELAAQATRQRQDLMELMTSARSLDLVLQLEQGRLSIATDLKIEGGPVAQQASERGSAITAMARHLACDAPIVGAIAFDVENEAQTNSAELDASLAVVPEPMRTALRSAYGASLDFLRSFDPGAIALVDPTPGSMHAALVLRAPDAGAARNALGDLLAACDLDSLGFDLSLPIRSRMANAIVENFTFRFDTRRLDFDARSNMRGAFEAFLGDTNLHLFVASFGQEQMILLGGDTAATQARLRAFSAPDGTPAELAGALKAIGNANPAAVWRIDATRLVTLGAELSAAASGGSASAARREALRAQPGLGSVPVVFWGGARSDLAFGGLEVDLDALERAAALLKGR